MSTFQQTKFNFKKRHESILLRHFLLFIALPSVKGKQNPVLTWLRLKCVWNRNKDTTTVLRTLCWMFPHKIDLHFLKFLTEILYWKVHIKVSFILLCFFKVFYLNVVLNVFYLKVLLKVLYLFYFLCYLNFVWSLSSSKLN